MTDEELVDELFRMAGRCLGQWSAVEYAMADLFVSLHGQLPARDNHLRAVFETIQSLDVRLAILRKSAELVMINDKGFIDSYMKIHERIRKLAKRRNQVAHFSIIKTENPNKPEIIKLHPFYSPSGSYNNTNKPALNAKQLCLMRESFVRINDRTIFLSWYVRIRLGIAERSLRQLVDPHRLLYTSLSLSPTELSLLPQ